MSLFKKLRATMRSSELNREIDEELQTHIALRTADNRAAGMGEREARRDALVRFGSPAATRENVSNVRSFTDIPTLREDVRLAIRRLTRAPAFTVVAVLTLALGIGANIAIFSVVETVLLRHLPYKNPERLVVVWQADAAHHGVAGFFDFYREYQVWQANSKSFEKLAPLTWATDGKVVLWHGSPVDTLAIPVGLDFFSMLGVPAEKGRTFFGSDLNEGCALVLSHRFWQDRLGSAQDLMGQNVEMSGRSCRILGIMPASFSFYPVQTDAWSLITPSSDLALKPWTSVTGVFGLLRPGVTAAAAQEELKALQLGVVGEIPAEMSMFRTMTPSVQDLQSNFTWLAGRSLKAALWSVMGAVVLILLMACVNLATLLLGGISERTREIATRSALGASRGRLFRQLFTEALIMAMCGTGAGLLLGFLLLQWFKLANPVDLPPGNPVMLDWHAVLFASILGIGSALLFGMLPALRGSKTDLNAVLRSGERGNAGSELQRASKWFVTLQVALSLVLLTCAGMLGESLWKLASTSVGYRTTGILTASVNLPSTRYPDEASRARFAESLDREATNVPGLQGFALASDVVPSGTHVVAISGLPTSDQAADGAATQVVSPSFFSVLGLTITSGRAFDTRDRPGGQNTAIINAALAAKYFGTASPLGRTIKLSKPEDQKLPWLTIVGVASNVRTNTVFQDSGYIEEPAVYLPLAQSPPPTITCIVSIDKTFQIGALQRVLTTIDGDLLLNKVDTLEHRQSLTLAQPRFRAALFGGFSVLALILAVLGLYGVLFQMVLKRTREIGIRMSVGADRTSVLKEVLLQASSIIGAGVALGGLGSLASGSLIKSLLYGVGAINLPLIGGACVLLFAVGMAAALKPAIRAASTNPVDALRAD